MVEFEISAALPPYPVMGWSSFSRGLLRLMLLKRGFAVPVNAP
jgi:hypothetical protein